MPFKLILFAFVFEKVKRIKKSKDGLGDDLNLRAS